MSSRGISRVSLEDGGEPRDGPGPVGESRAEPSAAALASKLDDLCAASLPTPGTTSPALRLGVFEWAAGDAERPDLPLAVGHYLTKVVRYAFSVTDDDFRQLYQEGLENDEIFELTVAAALGAAKRRTDIGLRLLGFDL